MDLGMSYGLSTRILIGFHFVYSNNGRIMITIHNVFLFKFAEQVRDRRLMVRVVVDTQLSIRIQTRCHLLLMFSHLQRKNPSGKKQNKKLSP